MKIIDAHVHIVPETAMGEVNPRFGGCLEPYGFQRLPDGSGYQAMPPWFHDSRFTPEARLSHIERYLFSESSDSIGRSWRQKILLPTAEEDLIRASLEKQHSGSLCEPEVF